jgi:NRPS condensation-like uncharacterized protein
VAAEPTSPSFARRIPSSSTDKVFGLDLEREPRGGQGCVLVFFAGKVDAERMRRAAELSLTAEPHLRYAFVNDGSRPYWSFVEEAELEPVLEVHQTGGEALKRFLTAQGDPGKPPQVRLGLFQAERDILCLRVNHIAVDGGGAVQYLYLLAQIYREIAKDPAYCPPPGDAARPGPRKVLKAVGPLPPLKALTHMRIPAPALVMEEVGTDRSELCILYRQIGRERMALLRAFAKQHGATMNDLLVAAFARAMFSAWEMPEGKEYRLEVPVSLRRHLPPSERRTICNLTAAYFLELDRREESYAETVARTHAGLEKAKKENVELAEMMLLELITIPGTFLMRGIMERGDLSEVRATLSNLGVVDEALLDFGVEVSEVRDLAPPLFPLTALTFRERMSFSLVFYPKAVAEGSMEKIMERFLAELPGTELGTEGILFPRL